MRKPRAPFDVYRNGSWEGRVSATSEEHAINCVRHREYGEDISQYGYGEDWEAVQLAPYVEQTEDEAEEEKPWWLRRRYMKKTSARDD